MNALNAEEVKQAVALFERKPGAFPNVGANVFPEPLPFLESAQSMAATAFYHRRIAPHLMEHVTVMMQYIALSLFSSLFDMNEKLGKPPNNENSSPFRTLNILGREENSLSKEQGETRKRRTRCMT